MIIDTHIHESKYSSDSKMTLEEVIEQAKKIGLDGICITDHDNDFIREEAKEVAKKMNFTVIVGAEILTHEGDVLVFGMDKLPDKKIHAWELTDMVHEKGGIAISAHPFRNNNRGLGENIRRTKYLNAIETFNGSTLPHHNLQGFTLAVELGIPSVGASDAHIIDKIGTYATRFLTDIKDEKDFIQAIKDGNFHPVMKTEEGFKDIDLYMGYNKKL
ncbi:PHP domain-containing protein [Haloimpatiens lingqiaonensis]|uniref:PHP domain-containing protein n=1 Tax=Haloimpatiens lingqiaonensis TaxID=1380675 RepID=UPI0010FDB2FB|nr:PHP domain-containing protein [Haloimpatiens lingqiaonensis]